MGNYLSLFRAPQPTPDEDERNHPAYYDWTVPKWDPFLDDSPGRQPQAENQSKKVGSQSFKESLTNKTAENCQKKPSDDVLAVMTIKSAGFSPSNQTDKSTSKSLSHNSNKSIKTIESGGSHRVPQANTKNRPSLKDSIAEKAANNIHAVKNIKDQKGKAKKQ